MYCKLQFLHKLFHQHNRLTLAGLLRLTPKIIFYYDQCRYIYSIITNPDLSTIMKKITLSILLLLSFVLSDAQFKEIAAGPAFEEPTNGAAKLLLMKNGNTVFLRVGFKNDGVDVRMYDQQHKEILFTSFKTISQVQFVEQYFFRRGAYLFYVSVA